MGDTDAREGAVALAPPAARIGRYELRNTLGQGSTGRVYLAWDPFGASEVALKVFDALSGSRAAADDGLARQFMSEASLVGKLSHPHIASILEASVGTEPAYIAMEYVRGGTLQQYSVADRLLPAHRVMQIAFKTCGALDYASKKGIVHRDLKPANLLLAGDTHVKVADFGAARLKEARGARLSNIGSPAYMSPERIADREQGSQSDMFSMGVSLYELLTGHRPFVGADLAAIMEQVLRRDPPAPSTIRPGISGRIDDLVLRMLAKNPAERHSSWADLALDIAEVGRLGMTQQEVPDSERFGALRALPLLGQLDDAGIWELVHAGRWRRVPDGSLVVREGEQGRNLFFLARGQAKVTRHGRLLGVLRDGEYFGEMAYVKDGGIPRQASVETITDALLCEFDPERLRDASLGCRLQLAHALLDSVVDRLQLANARLVPT